MDLSDGSRTLTVDEEIPGNQFKEILARTFNHSG